MRTPCLKTRKPQPTTLNNGFALLSALWFSAIISVIGLSLVDTFLDNTKNITRDAQRVQTDFLHKAALNYAVLNLLKPRDSVVLGGVPHPRLRYQNKLAPVDISIKNEAAFLDLRLTPSNILTPIFKQLGLSQNVLEQLEYIRQSKTLARTNKQTTELQTRQPLNVRWLRQLLRADDAAYSKITQHTSFYNGSTRLNQATVSESLLRALPELSASDASAILDLRNNATKDLISDAISHSMLSNRASSHYRITTSINWGTTISSKTRIVNIGSNQSQRLFDVVAQL